MSVRGYVVRGAGRFSGRTLYCAPFLDDGEVHFAEGRQHAEHATLAAAIGAERHAHASCCDVVILAVAEDGTETPLPSYEEALAEIVKLTIERNTAHLTALASVDETAAVYERETRWHSVLAKGRDAARAQAARFRKLAASWGVPEEKLAEVDAIDHTDPVPPHDLTPSEVALAKILYRWPALAILGGSATSFIRNALTEAGFVEQGSDRESLTDKGQALLDRARKAGVL